MSLIPELTWSNLPRWILIYYWGARGFLSLDSLPAFFSEEIISMLCLCCVGWIACEYLREVPDLYVYYCRMMSPKIITEWGDFTWDGITHKLPIGGVIHNLYYGNGCSYDGVNVTGDVAITCPQEHVKEIGQNRIIKTSLCDSLLPADVRLPSPARAFLYGSSLSPYFVQDPKDANEISRLEEQVRYLVEIRDTYHRGFKQVTDFLQSHSNIYGLSSTIKSVDENIKKLIEAGKSINNQVESPKYYNHFTDGEDY